MIDYVKSITDHDMRAIYGMIAVNVTATIAEATMWFQFGVAVVTFYLVLRKLVKEHRGRKK